MAVANVATGCMRVGIFGISIINLLKCQDLLISQWFSCFSSINGFNLMQGCEFVLCVCVCDRVDQCTHLVSMCAHGHTVLTDLCVFVQEHLLCW